MATDNTLFLSPDIWNSVAATIIGAILLGLLVVLWKYIKLLIVRSLAYIFGSKIVLVGPSEGGKSSFIKYIKYGDYVNTAPIPEGHTSLLTRQYNGFCIVKESIKIKISSIYDVPGNSPDKQIDILREVNPEAIIVFVDANSDQWLDNYTKRLNETLRQVDSVIQKLKSIVVVVNKFDLSGSEEFNKATTRYRNILTTNLKPAIGEDLASSIKIVPCTLVKENSGSPKGILLVVMEEMEQQYSLVEAGKQSNKSLNSDPR